MKIRHYNWLLVTQRELIFTQELGGQIKRFQTIRTFFLYQQFWK